MVWHILRIYLLEKATNSASPFSSPGASMGEVIRFVPKAELERARLIREARAIYDSIFPPDDRAAGERRERSDER
jgi:hypothetical protein